MDDAAYEYQAFHPSAFVLNRLDEKFFADGKSSMRSASIDTMVGCVMLAVFAAVSVGVGFGGVKSGHGIASSVFCAGLVFAAALFAVWGVVLQTAISARSELKAQGYLDDELPISAELISGTCWLPTDKAVHIVETYRGEEPSVRTVFYDAIGRTVVSVRDGREFAKMTGRDGAVIAVIESPVGHQTDGAHGLARLITERAAKAKAA